METQKVNELTEIQQVNTTDSIMLLTDEIDNVVERTTVDNLLYNSISTDDNNALKQGVDNKLYVGSALNLYDSEYNYSQGQWVLDNNKIYKSLVDDNIGNPTSDTDYWEEVQFGGGGGANVDLSNLSATGEAKFDAKVDVSSLSEIYPVISTWVSGTEGYRIWSDGYCEQWGYISAPSSTTYTVTFVKTFADVNYTLLKTSNSSTDGYGSANRQMSYYDKTVSNFKTYSGNNQVGFDWKACGYLAEGEY